MADTIWSNEKKSDQKNQSTKSRNVARSRVQNISY